MLSFFLIGEKAISHLKLVLLMYVSPKLLNFIKTLFPVGLIVFPLEGLKVHLSFSLNWKSDNVNGVCV